MEIFVRPAEESDIEKIKPYIEEYSLDNEDLDHRQFFIAEIASELAGFGRIKQYGNIYELATLGVIEKFRKLGTGKKIVEILIQAAPCDELWLTTLIPVYFEKFGFVEDDDIPEEIFLKCQRVCGKLCKTTENSCYMRYKKSRFT